MRRETPAINSYNFLSVCDAWKLSNGHDHLIFQTLRSMSHEAMEDVGGLTTDARWSCTIVCLVYQQRFLVTLTLSVEGHFN